PQFCFYFLSSKMVFAATEMAHSIFQGNKFFQFSNSANVLRLQSLNAVLSVELNLYSATSDLSQSDEQKKRDILEAHRNIPDYEKQVVGRNILSRYEEQSAELHFYLRR